jgi:mRNA interferase HicA
MKRVDLIKTGCLLIRHGARYDWYSNTKTGVSQPVPRHREIDEHLAKRIILMLSDSPDEPPE